MSREPSTDEETARLLEALEPKLPPSLYRCVVEAFEWRDTQISVLKRVIAKLIKPEENHGRDR